jgi:hypothetical protein
MVVDGGHPDPSECLPVLFEDSYFLLKVPNGFLQFVHHGCLRKIILSQDSIKNTISLLGASSGKRIVTPPSTGQMAIFLFHSGKAL